jgi:hypothetical protein
MEIITMRTAVPQVFWIPDLQSYNYNVFISYDLFFRAHAGTLAWFPGRPAGLSKHPFTQKEGEYPIEFDFTLFWKGVPYSRIMEDRVIVRGNGGNGIQSLNVNLKELFDDFGFIGDDQKSDGDGFLRIIFRGQDKDFHPIPQIGYWMQGQKKDSFFFFPASVCYGNPKASPQGLRTNFCEQMTAITYEPEENITTGLVLLNPQTRQVRHKLRLYSENLDGEPPEYKITVPPASAKLLLIHEIFSLEGKPRNGGVLIECNHKQVVQYAHMDLKGKTVYGVDHSDAWRSIHRSTVPITQVWRGKIAKALGGP